MRTSVVLAGAALLWAVLVPAEATARRTEPDACERIKPEQQLTTEASAAVDALIEGGMTGMGRGKIDVEVDKQTSFDTSLLEGDALAKAWTTYQLCVLKDSGAITPDMHQALMAKLFGLTPAEQSTTTAVAATSQGAVAGTSQLSFLAPTDKATVVLVGCPTRRSLGNPLPMGRLTWRVGGSKDSAPTDVGAAVDVPPGRVIVGVKYRYVTVSSETSAEVMVEAGKVHYLQLDYDLKMGNVRSMTLSPVGPLEGEERLTYCSGTRRIGG